MVNLDFSMPTLSIIIPTYKRPHSLYRLLSIIAEQKHTDFRDIDVVVVNDGSHDETYESLFDRNFVYLPFRQYKYIVRDRRPDDKPAVCASINLGVRESDGEVVLILDDGLVIDDHTVFIHRLLHTFLKSYRPCIYPYECNPDQENLLQFPWPFHVSTGDKINVWVTMGGNSMRREDWEAIGGLDEDYDGSVGFDDRDQAIRLHRAGCNIIQADGVTRLNDDWETGGSWTAKLAPLDDHRNGRLFFERWPEYRGHTWGPAS